MLFILNWILPSPRIHISPNLILESIFQDFRPKIEPASATPLPSSVSSCLATGLEGYPGIIYLWTTMQDQTTSYFLFYQCHLANERWRGPLGGQPIPVCADHLLFTPECYPCPITTPPQCQSQSIVPSSTRAMIASTFTWMTSPRLCT